MSSIISLHWCSWFHLFFFFYVLKVSSHLLQDIEQSRAFRDENTGCSKITAWVLRHPLELTVCTTEKTGPGDHGHNKNFPRGNVQDRGPHPKNSYGRCLGCDKWTSKVPCSVFRLGGCSWVFCFKSLPPPKRCSWYYGAVHSFWQTTSLDSCQLWWS